MVSKENTLLAPYAPRKGHPDDNQTASWLELKRRSGYKDTVVYAVL
jgi:hypothetical protein